MTSSTFRLPRSIFLIIIVVVTELILAIAAALILIPTRLLDTVLLQVLGFVVLFKTTIAIFAVLLAAGIQPIQPRVAVSRGAGFVLGRVVGFLVGGILGGRYGGWILGIVGIFVGSVLIGQLGSKLSYVLALQLERLFPSGEEAG